MRFAVSRYYRQPGTGYFTVELATRPGGANLAQLADLGAAPGEADAQDALAQATVFAELALGTSSYAAFEAAARATRLPWPWRGGRVRAEEFYRTARGV